MGSCGGAAAVASVERKVAGIRSSRVQQVSAYRMTLALLERRDPPQARCFSQLGCQRRSIQRSPKLKHKP